MLEFKTNQLDIIKNYKYKMINSKGKDEPLIYFFPNIDLISFLGL